ncbi:MAG: glycogen synthase [Candidatus Omnitrophota bacterium]|jgi:starch synthase|nr:MAG: glycogen synthase [Candidatus Omnitrophota bacterium]
MIEVLYCSSEVVPFAKTGGLADVSGALPLSLEKLGVKVNIVMPLYSLVDRAKFKLSKAGNATYKAVIGSRINIFFIENKAFFDRPSLYTDSNGDYKDNLERFSYYCNRSLALIKEFSLKPDVIHCNDWQTCLIPVYLKANYSKDPYYKNIKTLLTLHNLGYQGIFPKEEYPKLGLDNSFFSVDGLEFYGKVNLLKAGIRFCDIINTVSPRYSRDIQTSEFGFGLEGLLKERSDRLYGILNGIDYSIWDPRKDDFIARKFSPEDVHLKTVNKNDLQKVCSLPQKDVPVVGMVSRIVEHKGFDIICEAIDKICSLPLQVVILGKGEDRYEKLLKAAAKKYPGKISVNFAFDDLLAHKIYAGADMFLMPSQYEPCGLGQMISLKYGSIPIVFNTGGLADSVNEDNGFVFYKYGCNPLAETVKKALAVYTDKKEWAKLVVNAMEADFSWERSARQYIKLYEKAKEI